MNIGRLFCFIGAVICGWTFYELGTICNTLEGTKLVSPIAYYVLYAVTAGMACISLGLLVFVFFDD